MLEEISRVNAVAVLTLALVCEENTAISSIAGRVCGCARFGKNPEQIAKINIDTAMEASGAYVAVQPYMTYGQWEQIRDGAAGIFFLKSF